MELLNSIWDLAKKDIKKIVLPEGEERRTIEVSRGFSVEDIVNVVALTAVQAQNN